jgi:hypothetical protein
MFSKIVVALNDFPESQRVPCAAIDLAPTCNAEIGTVSDPVSADYCRTAEAK